MIKRMQTYIACDLTKLIIYSSQVLRLNGSGTQLVAKLSPNMQNEPLRERVRAMLLCLNSSVAQSQDGDGKSANWTFAERCTLTDLPAQ